MRWAATVLPSFLKISKTAGQVELALLLADAVERGEQRVGVEGVGAEVDLADRKVLGVDRVGVLRLDDALDVVVLVADDAAVGGRVEQVGCESVAAAAPLLVRRDEAADRVGGDERMVAGEDHEGLPGVDVLARREHRGAGALAGRLGRGDYAVRQRVLDTLAGPDDGDDALGAGVLRSGDGPMEHRPPADRVQNLRSLRPHPSSMAGRHDEHGGARRHEAERSGAYAPACNWGVG